MKFDNQDAAGKTRGTWCWRKIDGEWRVTHQHLSAPYDARTGKAALDLKP